MLLRFSPLSYPVCLGLSLLVACQPPEPAAVVYCDPFPAQAGALVVQPGRCSDQELDGGEQNWISGVYLANQFGRGWLRSAESSLTVHGVGGGTLIDAGSWTDEDVLQEAIPLIKGGWLTASTIEILEEKVKISGTITCLPYIPCVGQGELGSVIIRQDPKAPDWIAEGADGWWVHARPNSVAYKGALQLSNTTIRPVDGTLEDLGGAMIFSGERLRIAPTTVAWPKGHRRAISVPGATRAHFIDKDGARLGHAVLTGGKWEGLVPPDTTQWRVTAYGRQTSPWVAIDDEPELGHAGTLVVDPLLKSPGYYFALKRITEQGDGSTWIVDSDGSTLSFGAGVHHLEFSGSANYLPWTGVINIPPDETVWISPVLRPRFDVGSRIMGGVGWPHELDYRTRRTDLNHTGTAVVSGYRWMVFATDSVPADIKRSDEALPIVAEGGLLITGEGWRFFAYSWSNTLDNARGALRVIPDDPVEAFNASTNGGGRKIIVDQGWLEKVTDLNATPSPYGVLIDNIDPQLNALTPWFQRLDQGQIIRPFSQQTWIDVTYNNPDDVDVNRGIERMQLQATLDGLLEFSVDGYGPGTAFGEDGNPLLPVPEPTIDTAVTHTADTYSTAATGLTHTSDTHSTDTGRPPITVTFIEHTLRLSVSPAHFDRLLVVGSGGEVLFDLDPLQSHEWTIKGAPTDWLAAVAVTNSGEAWAVTAPVWLNAANQPEAPF